LKALPALVGLDKAIYLVKTAWTFQSLEVLSAVFLAGYGNAKDYSDP
jgi:hypothetical protein